MANQAIALQARAPQSNPLAGAIQQNAQMINMLAQQRTAERQAAVAAQEMEIARAAEKRAAAKEGRDIEKFAVDQDALLYAKYRNMAPAVIESNSPEVYREWLGALVEESPERGAIIAQAMPVERFDAAALSRMMATMDDLFAAKYGKAITRELIDPVTGAVSAANISSLPGASFSQPVPDISRPRARATPMQTPMSAPGVDARATQGTATAPADLRAQGVDPRSIPMGNPLQPISMTTGAQMGGQPDMTAVVQDMMSSGQISQSNLQLMREMAGPDKDAQLAEILKANNIQIVPDAQPQTRSAVFRPDQGAAPQMQRAQFNPNDYEQARAKPTGESPTPGIYNVPTPIIKEVKAAETQGSEDVRVGTQPKIAGGTKRAELQEQRDFDYPDATGRFKTNLARLDSMLGEIQRLQKHPAYTRIIGPVDAFTLNFGRARGAQAIYNTLISMGTQEELQNMRRGNETGGAVGNVSDADIKLLERGFGALDQSQMEQDFDASVDVLVKRIKAARDRLVNQYRETYSYRLPKNWQPSAAPTRTPTKGAKKVGGFTILEEGD